MSTPEPTHGIDDCWNRIGVFSRAESRCPELQHTVHCHNCPVYTAAARALRDHRALPASYQEEWQRHLAEPLPARRIREHVAVVVFRVGEEWLCLPLSAVDEICQPEPVHRLPHLASVVLRGIVNIHGQIRLCFSLSGLLDIDEPRADGGKRRVFPRMVVARRGENRFVLLVDEVLASHRHAKDELLPVPGALSHVLAKFIKGVLRIEGHSVGLLDEALLFQAMEKNLK